MNLFNADGSEAESCGNAFRCVLAYLKKTDPTATTYTIQTPFTQAKAHWEKELIRTELQDPSHIQWNISLEQEGDTWLGHSIHTGVPHAIFFVNELEPLNVTKLGKSLSNHPQFAPHRANINFACLINDQVNYRTYERGVGETQACATGAAAVAIAASYQYHTATPIALTTRSGETITVDFSMQSPQKIHNLSLVGPARLVYEGIIEIGK